MTWTCAQTEACMSDYLDGLLPPAEHAAFDHHVNGCERCSLLVVSVFHALSGLHKLEQAEPSPQLVESILTVTQGPQTWRRAKRWLRSLQSPRFVYSAASVAATIVLMLTASGFNWRRPKLADLAPATVYRNADSKIHLVYARSTKFVSDLRVVYAIQQAINENKDQNPALREETIPQTSPKKEPGQTDNTNPSAPKQQNRANEIGRNLRVLACEFPILSGSLVDRRMP